MHDMKERIDLGKFTEDGLERMLSSVSLVEDSGARIDCISAVFSGISYNESTLAGSADTPEIFVVNLAALDCFTFIDYVEAMRKSGDFSEFKESLLTVRYRAGEISYQNRKHFFTDWINYNSASVVDCTELLGQGRAVCAEKILNNKDDGSLYLQGVPCVQRDVVYIPSKDIDKTVLQSLRTGDYIGVYSELPGLDVSHVGIFIKNGEASYLRHASRRQGKVIDEDFMSYIKNTPGIVVLRPEGE